MEFAELLTPEAVIPQMKAESKKQALQELSGFAAELTGVEERTIFEVLLERERLGTTGVGNGIAIPHGKLEDVKQLCGMFARLDTPVDFDAIDDQPVDLIFVLLAPESAGADHLKALAWVSRLLRDNSICEKIRGSEDREAILELICGSTTPHAA
tara:strand:+ start:2084 stop:2548 length:465 start_codon:yes stop_codon:yes gene_type:complete